MERDYKADKYDKICNILVENFLILWTGIKGNFKARKIPSNTDEKILKNIIDVIAEESDHWKLLKYKTTAKTAQTCPVCNGTGHVDEGFYRQTSGQWASSGGFEICRSCDGKGYVVV